MLYNSVLTAVQCHTTSASVRVRVGPVELYLPVQVKNLQMSGCTRVTLRPLVEEIPILGAVNITLLEEPIVDAEIYIADGVDIMILPAMKLALQAIIKVRVCLSTTCIVYIHTSSSTPSPSRTVGAVQNVCLPQFTNVRHHAQRWLATSYCGHAQGAYQGCREASQLVYRHH